MNEEFPYSYIWDDLGEIRDTEELCPGVYYVSAVKEETQIGYEYYIADRETSSLTAQAKAFGEPLPNHPELLSYLLGGSENGRLIVRFEAERYRILHKLPPLEHSSILTTATFGAEHHPEYFGAYSVPHLTTKGRMVRYRQIMWGVFAIETETCERLIAVCYPLWTCDLSDHTADLGNMTAHDLDRGVNESMGYLFFSEIPGCLAIFELWQSYPAEIQASDIINMPAVMNAIWTNYPMYAEAHNSREQQGLNDESGLLFQSLGLDVELKGSIENMIAISPDAGTDYLIF